jgi:hypothetical protein
MLENLALQREGMAVHGSAGTGKAISLVDLPQIQPIEPNSVRRWFLAGQCGHVVSGRGSDVDLPEHGAQQQSPTDPKVFEHDSLSPVGNFRIICTRMPLS